jgi:hypothetical protein
MRKRFTREDSHVRVPGPRTWDFSAVIASG